MSVLDGMSEVDLRARLSALQTAYLELAGGAKIATASYTQGEGSRTVSYTLAKISDLTAAIQMIQRQLGMPSGRAPLVPQFRG